MNQQRTSVVAYLSGSLYLIFCTIIYWLVSWVTNSCFSFFCCAVFQICNAVAIAGFLNATLIIPNFHFHSIWRDPRSALFLHLSTLSFVWLAECLHTCLSSRICHDSYKLNGFSSVHDVSIRGKEVHDVKLNVRDDISFCEVTFGEHSPAVIIFEFWSFLECQSHLFFSSPSSLYFHFKRSFVLRCNFKWGWGCCTTHLH